MTELDATETVQESKCDVCGAEVSIGRRKSVGQLILCEECAPDFGDSNVVGCCAPIGARAQSRRG